jgi:hypothetical protein
MVTITPTASELQLRAGLSQRIQSILDTKVEDLIQAGRLGEMFSFAAGRPLFEKTFSLYRLLASANLELVSEAKLRQLTELTDQVVTHFAQFRGFQPHGGSVQFPTPGRDNLLNTFSTLFDQVFAVISTVLAVSQPQNLGQYESEAKASAQLIKTFFDEQKKQFEGYKNALEKEITETLSKARQAAQEVGITRHEGLFRAEADEHKKMAKLWLTATSVLAIATGLLAWVNYSRTITAFGMAVSAQSPSGGGASAPGFGPTSLALQLALAKVIAFSILFSAVLWAGRIYRAHRHNYVVNKHRQNALSTFEAFAKASEDTATKNAVLLQATQCIFGPQSTGYLPQEKESEGSTQILEIIRGAASGKT